MDFSPDEGQQAVADVVTSVLERDNSWEALVSGGVTALGVPERLGGDGVGLAELATALTEIGRHGTISPALATLGLGLVPLLDLASEEQQDRYLAGVAKGAILTAALNEPGAALPDRPATTLTGGRLNGTKVGVPYAAAAEWILVTADSAVVVVSTNADGVELTQTPTSNGGEEYAVTFSDVAVDDADVLAGATAQRVNELALAATGAFAAGLVAGALRLTADYVANRHQFGRPLSTFQTVAAQLAEVYIASRTLDLAATSVVWGLAERGDADPQTQGDLEVLGYWLTSQAPPVMQTCHHLHGGMGMDITYPMDRYYSTIKDLSRLLGGPSHRLDLVGA
ncbi:acyl-CoA dehydrogenase family protein [Mycolicibacterium litorale]|uniref:acyl-CoA dehydrogenase family protein n=1 Tax=Mycolicibacterium litorale TaxID=758802 RepID=UPI003CECF9FB